MEVYAILPQVSTGKSLEILSLSIKKYSGEDGKKV